MNNPAFDVAIGLVFIYLLYSLLATTINEFIASLFDYRARMLERGLEQMLDGKNYSYYWWDRLVKPINNNRHKPTSKFYIKTHLFTNEISCHPLFVRSAENSRFSKKPSYLPADVFSDILIDLLKENGKPPLLKDILATIQKRAVDKTDPLNKDLEKILCIYIDQANGDMLRFKLLIENWYNDTMDRVSGWYKRQANKILILIGFVLAVMFNVSTINIISKLSTNKPARDALIQTATDYIKNNTAALTPATNKPATGNTEKSNINTIDTSISTAKKTVVKDSADTTHRTGAVQPAAPQKQPAIANAETSKPIDTGSDTSLQRIQLGIANIQKVYKENLIDTNTLVGVGWGDFGYAEDTIKYKHDTAQYNRYIDSMHQLPANKRDTLCAAPKQPKVPSVPAKIWYVLYKTFSTPRYFLGFLITAFAISLGAPFWFDLLNKFISLRVTGAKPDTKKSSTPISKTASLNQKPDPTAKG